MVTAVNHNKPETNEIWKILGSIPDPEIPVITIVDLGIVRNVQITNGHLTVEITPTYSGCPATDMIATQIKMELLSHGFNAEIKTVLAPAWTTDWISEEGKAKLHKYGIAPPSHSSEKNAMVACPQCSSTDTVMISRFGSTPCKSLYRCNNCLECFDLFKCH